MLNGLDLPHHFVGQLGAISTTDEEALVLAEKAAHVTDPNRSFVTLGIDHEYACRGDDDVIDVPACARHAAVVQEPDTINLRQGVGQVLLTLRTPSPSPC